jgi:hypothetical protein
MSGSVNLNLLQRQVLELQRELGRAPGDLNHGGGGGTSGGMEERVAKLEAHLEHMRQDLSALRPVPERLRALEVRVDHLPSKGFIVTASALTISLLTAAIVFADKLRMLVGG